MTERLEDIRRRLDGLDDIGQVVGALRAIASAKAAHARDAVTAIRRHSAIISDALVRVLAVPAGVPDGPGLALVIGAAQGFSGAYPARIAAAAEAASDAGMALLVLGERTRAMLSPATAAAVVHAADLPTHVAEVPARASETTDALVALSADHRGPIRVVAGRDAPGQPVETRRLWPPATDVAGATGTEPLFNLPKPELVAALLNELLFASVTQALMEGYRAENQARFEAMARAQSNLRDRQAVERHLYQQARQEQMTTEIIELAAGTSVSDSPD